MNFLRCRTAAIAHLEILRTGQVENEINRCAAGLMQAVIKYKKNLLAHFSKEFQKQVSGVSCSFST
jgi:hypothetical protein